MATFGRDRKLVCDLAVPYDRSIYVGDEEVFELRLLAKLLKVGDVFVDCGANIGLYTVIGAHFVGDTGCVVAIEPFAPTFTRLQANVELSRIERRVRLVSKALAAETGATVGLEGGVHNIMRVGPRNCDGSAEVDTVTLDALLDGVPRIAGVKLDVEGSEWNALVGGEKTLSRCWPWALVEFNRNLAGSEELSMWEVHRLLSDRGYKAYLPRRLLSGDRTPLPGNWRNPSLYTNLMYWHGSTPVPRLGIRRALHGA